MVAAQDLGDLALTLGGDGNGSDSGGDGTGSDPGGDGNGFGNSVTSPCSSSSGPPGSGSGS